MTTTLVTGGSGFVGSHLVESLLAEGHTVYIVDDLSTGRLDNLSHLLDHDNLTVWQQRVETLERFPAPDRIYHLASRASPDEFTTHPKHIMAANTTGLQHLLEYAADTDTRVLYASTSEVYGNPEQHPQPESYHGNVEIRGPRSCYDVSKRYGETLAHVYQQQDDVDIRTVRIFNTYGPRMSLDDGRVISTFIRQALQDSPLTVYGDGTQTRSFCYITDLLQAMKNVMRAETPRHDVYNIGSEAEITIKELAQTVRTIVDTDSTLVYEDLPEDDPERRRPDLSRIKSEFDYTPDISLMEGLQRTVASHTD